MATTKRKHTYVDFRQEPGVPLFAKLTNAIATGADNQEDYFRVGGTKYFELIQTGANSEIDAGPMFTPSAAGWLAPIDATTDEGFEMTQGIITGSAKSFVTATDPAFFLRFGGYVGTIANHQIIASGFRLLAAYEDFNNAAAALTAYSEKAIIGCDSDTGTGAMCSITSKVGANLRTAATHAALADATWFCYETNVSAAGVVTYRLGTSLVSYAAAKAALAADTLLTAVPFTFTAATEVVPCIVLISNGNAISDVQLIEYECGYQSR